MSISSEISRLSGNISDAFDAIEAKGVTIPSGANSDNLATLIAQIDTDEVYWATSGTTTSLELETAYQDGKLILLTSSGTLYTMTERVSSTEHIFVSSSGSSSSPALSYIVCDTDVWSSASDVGLLPSTTSIPSKTSDLTNDSGFITGMTILSYGSSTWSDFLTAYTSNKVVYCRASSGSNPASGSQTRMAFLAYVNNQTTPTEVEFQYYRSVSTHSDSQQGDQVYVYKLTKSSGWSVTVREAYSKIATGTGISKSYSNGTITLSSTVSVPAASDATPENLGTAAAGSSANYSRADHVHAMPTASDVGALPSSTVIPSKVSDLTNDSGFVNASGAAAAAPVQSVNGKTGAVTVVEDDQTWNGVSLVKQNSTNTGDSTYVPLATSLTPVNMSFTPVKKTPTANAIAKYDNSSYLYSTTPSSNDNSTKVATTAYVDSAIDDLPEPMVFKGSLGTGGTITTLPAASSSNTGFTYKVITAGTYASQAAKVGDTFISDGTSWVLIPSGDEPSGTVTSVGVSNATNGGLSVSGSPITSSGTISIGHSNVLTNAQTTQAVYPIKIDKNGHISAYGSAVSVPSKTSDLTNDSGFLTSSGAVTSFNGNTGAVTYTAPVTSVNGQTGAVTITESDEKLKTEDLADSTEKYVLLGPASTTAETKYYTTGMSFKARSDEKTARLTIGISGNSSSTTRRSGQIALYNQDKYCILRNNSTTNSGYYVNLPASGGTLALTSEVPTKVSDLTNDSAFVNASGAAAAAPVQSVNGATGNVTLAVPSAATATPSNLGTAAVGTSTKYAKEDHVHNYPDVVHVGSTAPSDSNIELWLDNSSGGSSIVTSVDGKTGVVTVLPSGGTTGQVLKKVSGTSYDVTWANESGSVTSVNGQTGDVEISTIAVQDSAPTNGELVWIDTDESGESITIPQIDDNNVSAADTWSSQKIYNEISSASSSGGAMYFPNQTVNVATNAEIFRITSVAITTQTVLVECTFDSPSSITSDVTWTTYDGYIAFNGTCTSATTADVTLSNTETPTPQTPLAIANGGTGANNAADARTNLGAIAMPTIVDKSTTVSANVTDVTYTVSGAGVVVVFAGVVNASEDYGEWVARIYHNNSLVMGEGTRWATSSTEYFGASTSVPLAVANGDTIRIYLKITKGGSNKLIFRRFLCFGGCSVS